MTTQISALLLVCAALSACSSTSSPIATQTSQAELQATCTRHFANVSDSFERGNRITACVRKRSRQ